MKSGVRSAQGRLGKHGLTQADGQHVIGHEQAVAHELVPEQTREDEPLWPASQGDQERRDPRARHAARSCRPQAHERLNPAGQGRPKRAPMPPALITRPRAPGPRCSVSSA